MFNIAIARQTINSWPAVTVYDMDNYITLRKTFYTVQHAKHEAGWLKSCLKRGYWPADLQKMHGYKEVIQ